MRKYLVKHITYIEEEDYCMIRILLMIPIGLLIGAVMLALGGGGGAIYLAILAGIMGLPPETAAATSIITALPALLMGAYSYYRRGMINFSLGNRMMIAAIPSVVIGYFISPFLLEKIYKLVMGLILVYLGGQIIYGLLHHSDRNKKQIISPRAASILYGIVGGLMVGIAGLSGGGAITTGLLLLGVSVASTSATSSYVLVGMSLVGAILRLTGGHVDWGAAIGLIIGSLAGALLAPSIILWMTNNPKRTYYVKMFMGIFVVLMGLRIAIA